MVNAWSYAITTMQKEQNLDVEIIEQFGILVDPAENKYGFRHVNVWVGDHQGAPPDEIIPRMRRLVTLLGSIEPWEAYREFEHIHPFADGNGRVGKIIFNWLSNRLDNPIMPPDLFGGILNP